MQYTIPTPNYSRISYTRKEDNRFITHLTKCFDEESKLVREDEYESLRDILYSIEVSGISMFLSNASFERYVDILANNLTARNFILGISERFQNKLIMDHYEENGLPEEERFDYLEKFFFNYIGEIVSIRSDIQKKNSAIVDNVQASLFLTNITDVLSHNRAYIVLYMAVSLGVLNEFLFGEVPIDEY